MPDQKIVKQDLGALKIAFIYLALGGLWIVFSDKIAEAKVQDRHVLTMISMVKGWGYVIVTALLLYWLIQRYTIALNDVQARVTGIINSAMDAIISIDNSQRIVLFNPAAEKMFGYTEDEVMGQSLDMLIPKNYQAEHHNQINKFEQTGITNRHMNGYMEITGVKKNGDQFPIDTSISQIHIKEGKLFTAILRDVTEHKRVEETLRKMHDELELQFQQRTTALSETNALLETMLEYVPDQVYFKDAESRFIKNSMSQARALGLNNPSEAVGKTDFDFFPHAQRSYDEEQKIIQTGKPLVDFEERVIWPDGKETWVSTTKVPLRNQEGRIIGTFGISRDITDRKRAEESLRKAKNELEARVAEQTAELREANERLQLELNERKQADEALRDSEIRYRRLFETAKDGILILDADTGMIVDVNPFLIKLLGYSHEVFLGGTIWELGFFKDMAANKDNFLELQQKEFIRYDDLPLETANGQRINVEFVSNVYQVNHHRVIQCNIRDITERKQAEEKILSLSRFPDENPSPVLRVTQDGKILYANRAGADILKTWKREIHQSVPDEWQTHIRQVLESGLNIEIEIESFGKIFSCILSPIRDAGYVNIYCRDITERKQAEQAVRESEERLRLSLQAVNQGLYDLDLQSGTAIVNREYAQMLGYDPETFVETNTAWIERLHPDDREITAKMHADYINGLIPEYRVEFRQKMKDGNWKWILSLGKVVEYDMEGKPLRMLGTHADITNRKQAEEEIRLLNENLEQRIAERTAQLETANKELEAFSYSVSHDLRSPLRGIDGWSLALLEDYGHLLDEQGQAHIQKVRAEAQRMGGLIDDILKLSRITRAEMHKENVDLSAIAESVAARLEETKPEDRQVEFVIQKGLTVLGDPKLLEVVLTNLLDNAFKFTGRKQKTHIEFGQTIVEGGSAFFVRDNGAGFDMAYANKMFGVFQRMHRASEFPGTGVGLATVQRIINRHGGSIWASSEVGEGATFYFTLDDNNVNRPEGLIRAI